MNEIRVAKNNLPKSPLEFIRQFMDIIFEFHSEKLNFLIISEQQFLNNEVFFSRFNDDDECAFPIMGRFEIEGKNFRVIGIDLVRRKDAVQDLDDSMISCLTERELQIVALVAQGQSNRQIANQLRISEWTVATHLRRVFMKLKVDTRAAMVYYCAPLIHKLLPPTPLNCRARR